MAEREAAENKKLLKIISTPSTMDRQRVNEAIITLNSLLDHLSKTVTEPVEMTDEQAKAYVEMLGEKHVTTERFYIVASVLSSQLPYHVGAVEKLALPTAFFDADDYLRLVHPDYFEDYILYSCSAYEYIFLKKEEMELAPLRQSIRVTIPLKYKNGKYRWTRLAILPLQLDKERNPVTHLNCYTVLEPFSEKEPHRPLKFEIWEENHYRVVEVEQWTQELQRLRNTKLPFRLTRMEQTILDIIRENPGFRNADLADALQKKRNNIEKHNKNILAKAKESFPMLFSENKKVTLKELSEYLQRQSATPGMEFPPEAAQW